MTALDPGQLSYRPIERWLCLPIASTIVSTGSARGLKVLGLWWDDHGWKLDVVTVSASLWWSVLRPEEER